MKRRIMTLIAIALCFTACEAQEHRAPKSDVVQNSTAPPFIDVDAKGAKRLVQNGSVLTVDVRTNEEFLAGHIPGARNINVHGDGFLQEIAALDRNKKYLVHCAAGAPGGRSRRATTAMKALGFKKIFHLNGGFIAYSKWTENNPQAD